jgi:hypothetical protein
MRKGQKLVNYFLKKGWKNEDIHQAIFYMEDKYFDEVTK